MLAAGRVPEALDRFEQPRSFLADQLGTDPGRELQELHLQLLRGEGIAPAQPPAIVRSRSNLRAWPTSFVGRSDDVERVAGLGPRQSADHIVGPGGAGKTRLASEAAARWLEDGTEAAWLVELAPVTEPANIPTAILGALGLRDARVAERADRPAPEADRPTAGCAARPRAACWWSTTASI